MGEIPRKIKLGKINFSQPLANFKFYEQLANKILAICSKSPNLPKRFPKFPVMGMHVTETCNEFTHNKCCL